MATINTVRIRVAGLQGPAGDGTLADISAAIATHVALPDPHTQYLERANNLSDVTTPATAFSNIKQAATESATGVVELATSDETVTGTDTTRATTPAGVKSAINDALNASGRDAIDETAEQIYSDLNKVQSTVLLLQDTLAGLAEDEFSAEAQAFFARTTGLSSRDKLAYDRFIRRLVDGGIWDDLDSIKILAAADETTALTDLKSSIDSPPNDGSLGGSPTPTFTPYVGFETDGVQNYVDTGYDPADGPLFDQNSASFFVWHNKNVRSDSPSGFSDGTDGITVTPRRESGSPQDLVAFKITQVATSNSRWRLGNSRDLISLNRSSSGSTQLYYRGLPLTLDAASENSVAVNSGTLKLGHNGAVAFVGQGYGACGAGRSLNASKNDILYWALYELLETFSERLDQNTGLRSVPANPHRARPLVRTACSNPWSNGAATYPPAIYVPSTNKTWFCWEGRVATAQDATDSREVRVAYWDHETNTVSASGVAIPETHTLENDAHGHGSLVRDDDGYIHVFGGAHLTSVRWAKSDDPDGLAFTIQAGGIAGSFTYPHAHNVDGTITVFLRETDSGDNRYLTRWTEALGTKRIVDFSTTSRFYQGYEFVENGKVYIFAIRALQDDSLREDVYCFVYDGAIGDVSNLAGTVTVASAALPVTSSQSDASFRIINTNGDTSQPAVHFTSSTDIHIVYTDGSGEGSHASGIADAYYTHWDGVSWSERQYIETIEDTLWNYGIVVHDDSTIDLYGVTDPTNAFTRGGHITKRTRSRGFDSPQGEDGVWGGRQIILRCRGDTAIQQINTIHNAHPDMQVLFGEFIAETLEDGRIYGYAYGVNGFVSPLEF